MTAEWAAKYVGLEFEDGGRGPRYDCWGLLRKVYADEFGIDLPNLQGHYKDTYDHGAIAQLFDNHYKLWTQIEAHEARTGDAIVLRIMGLPIHFGVMVSNDSFLHVERDINSVVERTKAPRWQHRIIGYWRHKESEWAPSN